MEQHRVSDDRSATRLLRCARNDAYIGCHCEERSDEAISAVSDFACRHAVQQGVGHNNILADPDLCRRPAVSGEAGQLSAAAQGIRARRRDPRRRPPRTDRQAAGSRRWWTRACLHRRGSLPDRRRPDPRIFCGRGARQPATGARRDRCGAGGRAAPADGDVLRPGGIDGALHRDGPRRFARCDRVVSEPVQRGDPALRRLCREIHV